MTAALWACTPSAPAPDAWRAELSTWKHPGPLPAFPLVDHRGEAFSVSDLKGAPTVVAFVFSRCAVPNACPLTMAKLREIRAHAGGGHMQFLVVTLDPEHDTSEVLASFARAHGVDTPPFRLATGTREVVDALTSLFNVIALRQSPGSADLNHVVKVAVLDKDLVPVREWRDNDFIAKEVVDAAVGQ